MKIKFKKSILTLMLAIFLTMTTLSLVGNVSAATTLNSYNNLTSSGQTIKASSSQVALLGININESGGGGDTLYKVIVDFENVSGFTQSDLDNSIAGVTIFADDGNTDGSYDNADQDIGLSVSWNNPTPLEVTITCNASLSGVAIPDDDAGSNSGNDFFVVVATSDSASDGDVFNVTLAQNDVETTLGGSIGLSAVTTYDITVDTDSPSVSTVEVDTDPIYDSDLVQVVTVTFDEAMLDDTTADPVITFSSGSWTSSDDGAYNGADTIWTETFTLTDADSNVSDVTIDVTGAKDAAGNAQEDYTPEAEFDIDSENPTVSDVSVSDVMLIDSDDGVTFWVNVTFSENMDTSAVPSFTFSPDVNDTANLTYVSGSWDGYTMFNASFTFADTNSNVSDVTIDVTGTTDYIGNAQNNYVPVAEFDIDSENPTATIAYSDTIINDDDVGDLFWVNITFSENMDTNTDPTVVFWSSVSTTLTGETFTWADNTHCNVNYTIADAGVTVSGVDVNVSGAVDYTAGNTMTYNNDTDAFNVTTGNPTFSSASAVGTNTINVTFSEYVTVSNADGSDFTATGANITAASASGAVVTLTTSNNLAIDYTASDLAIAADAVLNNDSNGNALTTAQTISDGQAPTINYVVLDADNDGNTNTYIDIYFNEAMDNTTFAAGDFEISDSSIGVDSVQSSTTSYVTLKLDGVLSTGGSPKVYVNNTITDSAGNSMATATNKTILSFRISLSAGWNLVSIPAYVGNVVIATFLSDISANVNTVYEYNASSGANPAFPSWSPGGGGDIVSMEAGKGYWIKMDAADTLEGNYDLYYGEPPAFPTQTLIGPGWNLIGHYNTYNKTSNTNGALASLNSVLSSTGEILYKYTATGGFTNIYDDSNYKMEPGVGYWLWISDTTTNAGYAPS